MVGFMTCVFLRRRVTLQQVVITQLDIVNDHPEENTDVGAGRHCGYIGDGKIIYLSSGTTVRKTEGCMTIFFHQFLVYHSGPAKTTSRTVCDFYLNFIVIENIAYEIYNSGSNKILHVFQRFVFLIRGGELFHIRVCRGNPATEKLQKKTVR
jgi:hypothetical protein